MCKKERTALKIQSSIEYTTISGSAYAYDYELIAYLRKHDMFPYISAVETDITTKALVVRFAAVVPIPDAATRAWLTKHTYNLYVDSLMNKDHQIP